MNFSQTDDESWNFGDLPISPTNQIEILRGVCAETLPFKKSSFKILKEMMVETSTNEYTVRAKTGCTRTKTTEIGWWVGYIERKDNVYFFATCLIQDINKPNPDFGRCRKEITLQLL